MTKMVDKIKLSTNSFQIYLKIYQIINKLLDNSKKQKDRLRK